MKIRIVFALIFASVFCIQINAQKQTPYLTDPAISPDSREIVFVSGGDIWSVPAAGGSGADFGRASG